MIKVIKQQKRKGRIRGNNQGRNKEGGTNIES
jgi:hypothetical protein